MKNIKGKNNNSKFILIVVVVLVVIAFALIFFLKDKNIDKKSSETVNNTVVTTGVSRCKSTESEYTDNEMAFSFCLPNSLKTSLKVAENGKYDDNTPKYTIVIQGPFSSGDNLGELYFFNKVPSMYQFRQPIEKIDPNGTVESGTAPLAVTIEGKQYVSASISDGLPDDLCNSSEEGWYGFYGHHIKVKSDLSIELRLQQIKECGSPEILSVSKENIQVAKGIIESIQFLK